MLLFWCSSGRLLSILLRLSPTEREDPEITRVLTYLYIYFSIKPFFHSAALFSKLPDVFRLIENDPLTGVWNNEASFPHIFSLRMASLPGTSVHIKVAYQRESGAEGIIDYWELWPPQFLLLNMRGRAVMRQGFQSQEAVIALTVGVLWSDFQLLRKLSEHQGACHGRWSNQISVSCNGINSWNDFL